MIPEGHPIHGISAKPEFQLRSRVTTTPDVSTPTKYSPVWGETASAAKRIPATSDVSASEWIRRGGACKEPRPRTLPPRPLTSSHENTTAADTG